MDGGMKGSFGLTALGYTLGSSVIRFREFERTVSVKGLAEREAPADIALWPIHISAANNDLAALYSKLESDTRQIVAFLGQFTVTDRDSNTPYIKNVRVVSTVEYYLSD